MMQVIKRSGDKEQVKFEKISKRITKLCKDLTVDAAVVSQKVIQGLFDGVTTQELDNLATEIAYSLSTVHPDYDKLATRLSISALHKDTDNTFSKVAEKLYHVKDDQDRPKPILADNIYQIVKKHGHILDASIDYNRDYLFDYFGLKTLQRSYLQKVITWQDGKIFSNKIVERPQHMWMRVALGIHQEDIQSVIETYNMLSTLQATQATPTLFNSGSVKNNLSSCFLYGVEDSISGIYDALKQSALLSQSSGGLGMHIHNIRSKGSSIYGTGGTSNGIVPMLKVFNETVKYVDQCLDGEAMISCSEENKKIQDIKVGDLVKNFDGQYSEVKNKKEFVYSGKMVELSVNNDVVLITENHPVLVIRNCSHLSEKDIIIKIEKGLLMPEWVEASLLTMEDICLGFE